MTMKKTLIGGLGLSVLASTAALANGTDFSFAVHDIIVSHHTPILNITVRNVSNSTDPADRDLRVVSGGEEIINIDGQVWCNSYDFAETGAIQAHGLIGEANIVSGPGGGAIPHTFLFGSDLPDHTQYFNGNHNLEDFDLEMPIQIPQEWDSEALIDMTWFNPVREVEEHLETFVENTSGTAADFLRQDDVFEVQLTISVVGWCSYESDILDHDYAGARYITVTAAIFYQGDDDIQNVIGTVAGGTGDLAAPVPNRARGTATTRGTDTSPPARNTRPARARVQGPNNVDAGSDDGETSLLLPAVQRVREAAARSERSGNDKAIAGGFKQQVGRGRARARAQVDALGAATSADSTDGLDNDNDGARGSVQYPYRLDVNNGEEPRASLLLPAVQRVREAASSSSGSSGSVGNGGNVILDYAGVEPDEIDNSVADTQSTSGQSRRRGDVILEDLQAAHAGEPTPVDALLVINQASGQTEPEETAIFVRGSQPIIVESATNEESASASSNSGTVGNGGNVILDYAGVEPDEID